MVTVFAFEILNSSCHVGPYGGPSRDVDPKSGLFDDRKSCAATTGATPGAVHRPGVVGVPVGDWGVVVWVDEPSRFDINFGWVMMGGF